MPRIIPAAITTEQNRVVTRPRYLLEFKFSQPLYLSTRGRVVWGGKTWRPCGLQGFDTNIGSFEWGESSLQETEIVVGNSNSQFGVFAALEEPAGKLLTIYDAMGDNPFPAAADVVEIFSGMFQDGEIQADKVVLRATNQILDDAYSPREFWGAAHGWTQVASARGRMFKFGDTEFRLDPAD